MNFDFVQQMLSKVKIGPIGRHPICPKQHTKWGPKLSWLFFHYTNPLSIWVLYEKLFTNFNFGLFWVDWQTPHKSIMAQNMGPKIHKLAFFHWTDPFLIWILCKKLLQNFKIGPLWADWQTPYFSKWLRIWGPKWLWWLFFS